MVLGYYRYDDSRDRHSWEPGIAYMGPTGKVAHLLPYGVSHNSNGQAYCGRFPWPGLWWGTGNQLERDKVETMPVCKSCVKIHANIKRAEEAKQDGTG